MARQKRKLVIGVEAKADEGFGPIIKEYYANKSGTSSNVPKRINALCKAIFAQPLTPDSPVGELRYQLLTGIAGTLIEAQSQRADAAIFLVYEFISSIVDEQKVKQNENDFIAFLKALSIHNEDIINYRLYGPITVPGNGLISSSIPLYLGKIQHEIDEDSLSFSLQDYHFDLNRQIIRINNGPKIPQIYIEIFDERIDDELPDFMLTLNKEGFYQLKNALLWAEKTFNPTD